MIISFRCESSELLFNDESAPELPPTIHETARRKLVMLDIAKRLDDLRVPPGNRLEALKGNLKGLHSIRINDQWRICFRWTDSGPAEVEILDYH